MKNLEKQTRSRDDKRKVEYSTPRWCSSNMCMTVTRGPELSVLDLEERVVGNVVTPHDTSIMHHSTS